MITEGKLCPLRGQETYKECKEEMCAWWSVNNGGCAVCDIADTLSGTGSSRENRRRYKHEVAEV